MVPSQSTGTNCDDEWPHSLDAELGILSHWLNRVILEYCAGVPSEQVDIHEVADHALEAQHGYGTNLSRESILIQLHHARLPHLEEAGIVTYDPRDRTISYEPDDALESWLEKLGGYQ